MTWHDISTAPKDGTEFLAWQDGEVYRSRIVDGRPQWRTHKLRRPKTYQTVPAILNGAVVQASVLVEESPEIFEHQWTLWTRGFEYRPSLWTPLPPLPPSPPQ